MTPHLLHLLNYVVALRSHKGCLLATHIDWKLMEGKALYVFVSL